MVRLVDALGVLTAENGEGVASHAALPGVQQSETSPLPHPSY